MKDYFSDHARIYATFRPTYPRDLYDFILNHCPRKERAWDCGTGNGQVAQVLSEDFDEVIATDISQSQIDNAVLKPNIRYQVCPAERSELPDRYFDLITVAQAIHWFDLAAFFQEAKRTLKREGVLAVWGYSVCSINPAVDVHLKNFYSEIVGPYWDEARKLVEDEYRSLQFPFEMIPAPGFEIVVNWTLDHFIGYITSWSATQKFIKAKGFNPVTAFEQEIARHWAADEVKKVIFPVFLKMGTVR